MNRETNSIEQGNRLIHDWMGHKRMKPPFEQEWIGQQKVGDLRYHSSWDSFMRVYKKFKETLDQIRVSDNGPTRGDYIEVDIHCCVRDFDLVGAHEKLVEGIEWYNKEQNVQASVATGGEQGTKS